jgi:CelD/BcsL family acetyltransferase involved in cellulose biosynthesis
MLSCDLVKACHLSEADFAAWSHLCTTTPEFSSPLLSPQFFQTIAKVRDDVFVAIYRRKGQAVGFLAHHSRPGRFARPVGAPFCDYCALITPPDPGFCFGQALDLAGIRHFQAIGLVDPYKLCTQTGGELIDAYGIDLSLDRTEYLRAKKHVKNIGRLRRHLEANFGALSFTLRDQNKDHFDTMISLKHAQIERTGLHDFLQPVWVQAMLNQLFLAPEYDLHGSLLTLMSGDHPVMFHYGVRLGGRMHIWLSAYDPQFAAFSPGQIFHNDCQVFLKAQGLSFYDMSSGQSHYKSKFCNVRTQVVNLKISSETQKMRQTHRFLQTVDNRFKVMKPGTLISRFGRRMDQVASLELDGYHRVLGLVQALAASKKRLVPQNT